MNGNLTLAAFRHASKQYQVKVTGSDEDVSIDLSEKGRGQAAELGSKHIPKSADLVLARDSGFVRAHNTLISALQSAGYQVDPANIQSDRRIGFTGNYLHPQLIVYTGKNDEAVLRQGHEDFYFKRDDAPCNAGYMAATLDVAVTAVEQALPTVRKGENALVAICTHGGIIDPFDAALFHATDKSYLTIDEAWRKVTLGAGYPEGYKYGELVTATLVDGTAANPIFEINGRGRSARVSLDDLKKTRDMTQRHSQMSY